MYPAPWQLLGIAKPQRGTWKGPTKAGTASSEAGAAGSHAWAQVAEVNRLGLCLMAGVCFPDHSAL